MSDPVRGMRPAARGGDRDVVVVGGDTIVGDDGAAASGDVGRHIFETLYVLNHLKTPQCVLCRALVKKV